MLLDTSYIIDVLRSHRPALALREEIESSSEAVRVPAPAVYELWKGVARARNPPKETEAIEEVMYPVVDLRAEHARRAGQVGGELARRGIVIGELDLLLAGTALVEDEALLTRNARDFERIPEMRVRTY
jgi:tRNA(fMet)-specific endonuclease VapC